MRVKLSEKQRGLLAEACGRVGAVNVWSINDARLYREMADEGLKLVRICKPTGKWCGTEMMPYFAVRLTAAGRTALSQHEDGGEGGR